MPSKTKKQQSFFKIVYQIKKKKIPSKGKAGDVAKSMTLSQIKEYLTIK